jgi:hypothetical protein
MEISSKKTKTCNIKVICAGLPRCGTTSLKMALEVLGFDKCYHATEYFNNYIKHDPYWIKVYSGEEIEWDEVFEGYQSCADFPACYCYKALSQYYPDAKIILNIRSAESWYDSMSNTIFKMMKEELPECFKNATDIEEKYFEKEFGNENIHNKDFMVNWYNERVSKIINEFPEERLLIFELSQGWEPLCKFLNTPIPNMPFPKLNSTEEFHKMITNYK